MFLVAGAEAVVERELLWLEGPKRCLEERGLDAACIVLLFGICGLPGEAQAVGIGPDDAQAPAAGLVLALQLGERIDDMGLPEPDLALVGELGAFEDADRIVIDAEALRA